MRTLIVILAAVMIGGCAQQGRPVESCQARRDRHLATLRKIYGIESDGTIARAIEIEIQSLEK